MRCTVGASYLHTQGTNVFALLLALQSTPSPPEDWGNVRSSPDGVFGADAATFTMQGEGRGIRTVWIEPGKAPILDRIVGNCRSRTIRWLGDNESLADAASKTNNDGSLQNPDEWEETLLNQLCDYPYLFDVRLLPEGSGLMINTDRIPQDLSTFTAAAPQIMQLSPPPIQCTPGVDGRWVRSREDC